MRIFDFNQMNPDMIRELNQIADEYQQSYTEFVDSLSAIYGKDEFWWDTPLVSRNIYICKCFENICTLRLMLDFIRREKPKEVIVAKPELKQAILDNVGSAALHVTVKRKNGIKTAVAQTHAFQRCMSKLELRRNKKKLERIQAYGKNTPVVLQKNEEIILTKVAIIPEEVQEGELRVRSFPGLSDNTDEHIVSFAYLYYQKQDDQDALLNVVLSQPDIICFERYVQQEDWKEAEEYTNWCIHKKVQHAIFDNMDVHALVNAAIWEGRDDILGILMGRTLCRLIEQFDLKVKRLIDWYEGQPSSNAMIRRLREKYPEVPTIGYVNFPLTEKDFGVFPSKAQSAANAVPAKYAVIGEIFQEMYHQYAPEAKTILAPALRFQGALKNRSVTRKRNSTKKCVLVALPYFTEEAAYILDLLESCSTCISKKRIDILLKNHPVNAQYVISDYGISKVHFEYRFIEGGYGEAVEQADVVVTASSTSSYETVLHGRPVISVCMSGLCTPMMPHSWEGIHYEIAYDAKDIEKYLCKFLSEDYRELDISEPNRYIVETSKENLKQLLEG